MIKSCKGRGYHHKSQLLNKTKDVTSPMIFITLGQVHNRSKKFENAALFLRLSLLPTLISHENEAFFLRLGLTSTLISHENGDFWKRSSNHRNLKTTALCFRAHRKHLENEGFRKRRGYDNRNISRPEYYSNTNPKWSVIVTLSNFSGIVCCERKTFDAFSVQNLRRTVDKAIGHYRNVRGLGKSIVVFRLFEKLRYSNERSTIF